MLDNIENELLVDGELPSVDAYSTWAVNHCVDAEKIPAPIHTKREKFVADALKLRDILMFY